MKEYIIASLVLMFAIALQGSYMADIAADSADFDLINEEQEETKRGDQPEVSDDYFGQIVG